MSKPSWLCVMIKDARGVREWYATARDAWEAAERYVGKPPGAWATMYDTDTYDTDGGGSAIGPEYAVAIWQPSKDEVCGECGRALDDRD